MKRTWIGILAIVVVIAAVAAPYVSGRIFERQFRAHVSQLAQTNSVPMEVVSYQRGWFTSEAETRIGTADDGFRLHHAINHNPFTTFALARVTSTPVLDTPGQFKQQFNGEPPLTITTRFGFTGAIDIHAVSPAFNQPLVLDDGATIRWGGLTADIHIADGRITYSVQAPQYAYNENPGSIAFKDIALQGSGPTRRIPSTADDWDADTHLSVGWIRLHIDDTRAALTLDIDIDGGLDNKGDYGVQAAIQVTDAVIQRLDDTDAEPFTVQKATLQTRLHSVSVTALKALLHDLTAVQSDPRPEALRRVFAAHLPKLLTRPAELQISVPEFSSNQGRFGLRAAASFDPASAETKELLAILGMARRLNVTLQAGIDKSLARYASPAQNHRLLDLLVEQKLLLLQNDRYTLQAKFDGPKHFTINGQPGMRALMWLRYLLQPPSGY